MATKPTTHLTVGDIVGDTRNPHRVVIGTVTDTAGTMYRNTLVRVMWHHLGYDNWESPDTLTRVHTAGRTVTVMCHGN